MLWRLSHTGGIQRVVRDLIENVDRGTFELHVCTVRPALPEDDLADLDVAFHSLGVAGRPSPTRRLWAALRLARVLWKVRPDVVHVHSGVGWYLLFWSAFRVHRSAVVVDVHDSPQSQRVSRLSNALERALLRRKFAFAVVHSTSVAADLSGVGRPLANPIETIPLGIAIPVGDARVIRNKWRHSHQISDAETVVSYVARLVESKHPRLFVDIAVELAPIYPRARFVLVGDGPERGGIAQFVDKSGLASRILVLGQAPSAWDVLAGSDVFLSTSAYEGFGIAVLEAMAAGTAVVATSVGGVTDLVVPEVTGLLAEPGDVAGLVSHLSRLLEDPDARARLALAGHRRAVESFRMDQMVARYESLYRAVAAGRR